MQDINKRDGDDDDDDDDGLLFGRLLVAERFARFSIFSFHFPPVGYWPGFC